MKIAVVEDHDELRQELIYYLSKFGHQVSGACNSIELDQLMRQSGLDLVLLDIGLPGEDGIEIARRLSRVPSINIIMLTARDGAEDRIQGFEAGADVYLVKPVSFRELDAVVQRVEVKKLAGQGNVDCWQIRPSERTLISPGAIEIPLTLTEASLLNVIASQPGKIAARQKLVEALGIDYCHYDDRRLEVSISRLRKKIMTRTGLSAPIKSCRNVGYSFDDVCVLR